MRIFDNFIVTKERAGEGPVVIRTSGYTSTSEALTQGWLKTQKQTLFANNRRTLPDPLIKPQKINIPYELNDASVYNIWFRPECKGLSEAVDEFAEYFNSKFEQPKNVVLCGNSKGALFYMGLASKIKPTNIILITPAIETIIGDEEAMLEKVEQYGSSGIKKMEARLWKKLIKTICSRRPIDKDICPESEFISNLDLNGLKKHNAVLIVAMSDRVISPFEKIIQHYGKIIGFPPDSSDSMVDLNKQLIPASYVKEIANVCATHLTVLSKIDTYLMRFLTEVSEKF